MKTSKKIMVVLFLGIVYSLFILQFVSKDKEFSDTENRYLQAFPALNVSTVLNGDFMDKMESYSSDQFPFRDSWILAKNYIDRGLLKIDYNGTFLTDDGIIQSFNDYDSLKLERNIEIINSFSKKVDIPVVLLIVPTASSINHDYLNSLAVEIDQQELIKYITSNLDINVINPYNELQEADFNPYYKSDHHFNEYGALIVYSKYMEYLNKDIPEYTYEKVSDAFRGSLTSKSRAFYYTQDDIYMMKSDEGVKVTVEYNQDGIIYDSVFMPDNLLKKDKYTFFLNGNQAYVDINTSLEDEESILVLTDSFGHLMAPYLINNFSRVTYVDLRYYRLPISEIADEYDRILVFYNVENFANDENIGWLK